MQRRFGIPLMLGLLALSSWASGPIHFNAYYLLVGVSAAWAAWDSMQIGLEEFDSHIAMPPVGLVAAMLTAWPLVFPWYLKVRYRIKHGLIGPKRQRSPVFGYVIVGVAVAAVIGLYSLKFFGGEFLLPASLADLSAVGTDVARKYQIPNVNVSRSGRTLTILLINARSAVDTAHRDEWTKAVAIYAYERYKGRDAIESVGIQFMDVSQRGALTYRESSAPVVWPMPQYNDTGTVTATDDSIARWFIASARSRDRLATRVLQPASQIGWDSVTALTRSLPNERAASTTLYHWEFTHDSVGAVHKLMYKVTDSVDTARVQVYVVERTGHAWVSAFGVVNSTRASQ